MSEKKWVRRGVGFGGAVALAVLLFACHGDFQPTERDGRAAVSIAVADASTRTVFPGVSLSDVASYTLRGGRGGAEETEIAAFAPGETSVFLEPGTWNFTLNAYNSGGSLILRGIVQNQAITLAGPNQITFNLFTVNSGTGAIQITLNFPATAGITRITASGDIAAEEFPVTTGAGQFTYTKTGIASGDHFVSFRLFSADTLKAVVSELVLVRGNVTSTKTIALAGEDLKGEQTPEIVIPDGGAIIRINTQSDLEAIRAHIDDPAYNNGKNAYVLQSDITLSGTWTPIGYVESVDTYGAPTDGIHAFSGNFYGNGHTIRNLVLPGGSIHYIGLFGYIENALMQDLQVELGTNVLSVTNSTGQRIGIIVGGTKNSTIKNCGVYSQSGITINGSNNYSIHFGGIAMHSEGDTSIIENCYVSMDITITNGGTHVNVGGLAWTTTVRNCYYIGTITSTCRFSHLRAIQALATQMSYTAGKLINNAANTGYTTAMSIDGSEGFVSNCATLMEQIYCAAGINYVRRITENTATTLTNNYAYAGMLLNGATVTSSDPNSQNGLDKTAAQLKQRSTYEDGLGWDFDDVWEMGPSSYPFPILKWQNGVVKLPPGFNVIGQ